MKYLFCLFAVCISSANSIAQHKTTVLYEQQKDTFIDSILKTNPFLNKTIAGKADLNIQIIYTKIKRDSNNVPTFTDYTYQLNNKKYFYPASTVKMPVAFLALEKLNELKKYGIDKYSVMITDSSSHKQSFVYTDPSSENSSPSIANYIKQIFLVSDNNAFNRLYEFLGQDYIHKKLKSKGYEDAVIRHRLQLTLTNEQNKATNAISFYDTLGNKLYEQPSHYSNTNFSTFSAKLGKFYYKGNTLIKEPFDFSLKNRLYLQDLHNMLRTVIFNEYVPTKQQFNFTKEDYAFLYKWMSAYPKESKYPYYDSLNNWEAYCKFLLFGSKKNIPANNIRIFNKSGDAYGFLTDIAYIVDIKNNVEFMLSATISCNSDGVYNDDKYDYENIGLPFMKNLGETLYFYELNREKKYKADLTKFLIDYKN